VQTPRIKPTFKLPEISPKNLPKEEATNSHSSDQDQVIRAAYKAVQASKGYANEKGKQYLRDCIISYREKTLRNST
jgi:hypothetical protein